MKKSGLNSIATIAAVTLMMGLFTNCSQGEHSTDSSSVGVLSDKDFFEYPYAAAPSFYGELSLLKPASQLSNLAQFKVVGTVRYIANAAVAINYTVKIKAPNGATLCPMQTGTIPANSNYFEFDCVSSVQTKTAKVEFTVSASGKTQTFNKDYAD